MIELITTYSGEDKNSANYDTSTRIRMPRIIKGSPGFIEYRGMPWLRGLYTPSAAEYAAMAKSR